MARPVLVPRPDLIDFKQSDRVKNDTHQCRRLNQQQQWLAHDSSSRSCGIEAVGDGCK